MFKVGDIIVDAYINGYPSHYEVTGGEDFVGEILEKRNCEIKVKVLEGKHPSFIGDTYWVKEKYFKLFKESTIKLK